MVDISAIDAVNAAVTVEDSIKVLAAEANKELLDLQHFYKLPARHNQWAANFAMRLSMDNKDYRFKLKQELSGRFSRLRQLYVDSHQSTPLQALQAQVRHALKQCRRAQRLHSTFKELYETRFTSAPLPAELKATVQRAVNRLINSVEEVRKCEDIITEKMSTWKDYFMVLSDERLLNTCLDVLHERKVSQRDFADDSRPLFAKLTDMEEERRKVCLVLTGLAHADATAWFNSPTGRIPQRQLDKQLARYEQFRVKIQTVNDEQAGVIKDIMALVDRSTSSPQTLPGPNGVELSIENLCKTFAEYELLRAHATRTISVTSHLIPGIRSVIEHLQSAF